MSKADLTDHETQQRDILSFWLTAPAHDAGTLMLKFRRWYQGGLDLDAEIAGRFGHLIERALSGALDGWRSSVQGRLALIILLDQWTRNVFRDTPRAYAGDAAARAIALSMLDDGSYETCEQEAKLFVSMPLVHAEDLPMLDRAKELAQKLVVTAPEPLEAAWQIGYERVAHYRSVIARFGRYPHRNVILGRVSTDAELRFLEAEARAAPVLPTEASG